MTGYVLVLPNSSLVSRLITNMHGVDAGGVRRLGEDLAERLGTVGTEEPIPYLPMTDEYYDHSIALHRHVSPGLTGGAAHRRRRA
ncbi:hypothetical protein [Tsukamurella sp. NPDC003166]|uniref:hypothetical protein n=1 Tax=Tsukamurella sp. NPDC003166 TaxID=3154444 RepID=UPI0033B1007C